MLRKEVFLGAAVCVVWVPDFNVRVLADLIDDSGQKDQVPVRNLTV